MTDLASITESKRQLRAEAIAHRSTIPADARAEAATKLRGQGLAFQPLAGARAVSGFLAIGEELDPEPLLVALYTRGLTLSLPVMQGKGLPLLFRQWAPGAPLETRMWGIREPSASAPQITPDVLLVPLLAFDRRGGRLGYGGGFYDRTLAELRAQTAITAVGLAFAAQEVDVVPHLDYDERLDWVLTPDGPIRCVA